MKHHKTLLALALLVSGCTSVTVKPLDASYNVKRICIRENPKVSVDDFVQVITDGLRRHNIEGEFIASTVDKAKIQDEDLGKPDQYYMELTPVTDACDFNLTGTSKNPCFQRNSNHNKLIYIGMIFYKVGFSRCPNVHRSEVLGFCNLLVNS